MSESSGGPETEREIPKSRVIQGGGGISFGKVVSRKRYLISDADTREKEISEASIMERGEGSKP